ncbi:MAG: DUF2157 domain-containing protein [Desulfotalea sp.]
MITPRSQIIELIQQGEIPAEKIAAALVVVKVTPDGKSWRIFLDQLLLWLGGLALAFAVMFFVAYNWEDIGRFAKFSIVEGVIILAVAAYCKLGEDTTASKVSLLVATICLGVLLALCGQTYQTGADPWQLFFYWALLMLPWAIIGRFPAIWIVWIVLINTSLFLYFQTFRSSFWFMSSFDTGMLWLAFVVNSFFLVAWEISAHRWSYLAERWAIRLLAIASGIPINMLLLDTIFSGSSASSMPVLVWAIWLALIYFVYRKIVFDLFMLAIGCLSGITALVSFLGIHTLDDGFAGSFLFLALVVIGSGSGAALWLKKIHQENRS